MIIWGGTGSISLNLIQNHMLGKSLGGWGVGRGLNEITYGTFQLTIPSVIYTQ